MLKLKFAGVIVAALCVLTPMRTIGQSADSPTGHNPRFLWSPQQQAAWNKMRSQDLPSWRQILHGCATDNTPSPRYASYGRWASQCYQITGDERYAEKALGQWSKANHRNWTVPLVGNALREQGTEYVMVMRERLLPWLEKTGNLTTIDTYLKLTAENVFKTGVRFNDSDQLTGTYFFLAAVDLALGTDYLTRKVRDPGRRSPVSPDGSTGFPIGGFAATGENDDTMRNAIAKYYGLIGEGGECIEGYEYCNGTEHLAAVGMQGVNDFTKATHYPEMMQFFAANAKQLMHQFTPDLKDAHKAGDVQTARAFIWHALDDNIANTAAISGSAELQQFWYDLAAANGREVWTTPFFYVRPFYMNNPYRRAAPWKSWAGLSYVARGSGHVYARSGWGPSDCSVHLFFPTGSRGTADHFPTYANFFRLRCGDTWLRDTVIAYSADWRLANTAVIMNTGASREVADLVGTAFVDGKVAYAAGVSGGYAAQVQPGGYAPPPPFYHENFGHRLVLFGPPGTVPTIVAMDRLSAEDPREQKTPGGAPAMTRYAAAVQTRFRDAKGVYDWLTHTPVAPKVDPDGKSFSWVVNGIEMRNAQVWPVEAPVITVVDDLAKHREAVALGAPLSKLRAQWKAAQNEPAGDEQKTRAAELSAVVAAAQSSYDAVSVQRVGGTVAEAERKFIVHQVPPYQPFLFGANCLTGGAGPSDRCVGVEFGDLKGVRVIRSAMPDVIFLASQRPSPKLPATTTRNAAGSVVAAFDRAGKATLLEQARIVTSLPPITVEVTGGREVLVYIADVEASVKTVNVNGKDVPLSRVGALAAVTVAR